MLLRKLLPLHIAHTLLGFESRNQCSHISGRDKLLPPQKAPVERCLLMDIQRAQHGAHRKSRADSLHIADRHLLLLNRHARHSELLVHVF